MKVFIDGESGTTGLQMHLRLSVSHFDLVSIPVEARRNADTRLAAMAGADLVILCLPDEAAKEAVGLASSLGDDCPRIIDASSAHRTDPAWVYGFAEMAKGQRDMIRRARYVSNPGCYATGAIAIIRPLVESGILPNDHPLTINAISGYSGGGTQMIAAYEQGAGPAFELYALGLEHKHIPEIVMYGKLERRPLFVPSVGSFRQGMLVCIPLHLDTLPRKPSIRDLEEILVQYYVHTRRVEIVRSSDAIGSRIRAETQAADDLVIYVTGNESYGHAVLIARLDNLGKGAAAAAMQNALLMCDDE